jgi:DNA modification methylase
MNLSAEVIVGDNRETLKALPDQSVQTVVTSPPYWGLRDYGTKSWTGGDESCEHIQDDSKTKKFGNDEFNKNRPSREATKVKGYYFEDVCGLCGATEEDYQIGLEQTPDEFIEQLCLVFDEVWRVLKDDGTIWVNLGDSYATGAIGGMKHKDLVGIPWRFAFAMQARGWYLRQDIIWSKPNPMPESVTDRCTKSHEYIFLMSKSARYFFDNQAIKEEGAGRTDLGKMRIPGREHLGVGNWNKETKEDFGRNKRSVWNVATKPYREAHFATYPPDLIEPCILAGSKEGDIVLDPFSGSGTTGEVALQKGRNYIGLELNPEYAALSEKRLTEAVGMFGNVIIR